ncbi:MAG: hypothetical protein DLM67_03030 [Candidatus Nephthysia bennettiae]|nr:MAG: hypothetical protein DLM67_03030 [Candidatus Dormibacteraeota bacterium]
MSASGFGLDGSGIGLPVGEAFPVVESSALIAWREAVQGARSVLLEASRLFESGSEAAVLDGLHDLESQIDSHLTRPLAPHPPPEDLNS